MKTLAQRLQNIIIILCSKIVSKIQGSFFTMKMNNLRTLYNVPTHYNTFMFSIH